VTRPNVLFVFSDQHRWCDLGCYGNPEVETPHLDALARQGLRCTHCVANAPLCVPSRGCLLTGLYPLRHRAVANDLPLSSQVRTVAHVLGEAGYHTGYIGKWHLAGVPRDAPVPRGARGGFRTWKAYRCHHDYLHAYYFDEDDRRVPVSGYGPEAETDLALAFLREAPRPWALWLSWGPPHDPYQAVPEPYLARYRRPLTLRPNVPDAAWRSPAHRWERADLLAAYQGYYAHITALDAQMGRLLEALDATGQAEDTVVVYTSDHGDMLGSHGFLDKQLPYDEAIRVPLLVRWPGVVPVGSWDGLIGLVELPYRLDST
jgi:arylsulfatase A-like enzyme